MTCALSERRRVPVSPSWPHRDADANPLSTCPLKEDRTIITALEYIFETIALIIASIMLTVIVMLFPVILLTAMGWEPSGTVLGVAFFVLFWLILLAMADHAWRYDVRAFGSGRNRQVERTSVTNRIARSTPVIRTVVKQTPKRRTVNHGVVSDHGPDKYVWKGSKTLSPTVVPSYETTGDRGVTMANRQNTTTAAPAAPAIVTARIPRQDETSSLVETNTDPSGQTEKSGYDIDSKFESDVTSSEMTDPFDWTPEKTKVAQEPSKTAVLDPVDDFTIDMEPAEEERPSASSENEPAVTTDPTTEFDVDTPPATTKTATAPHMIHANARPLDDSMLFSGRLIAITRPIIED